jgi:hypothetical protein
VCKVVDRLEGFPDKLSQRINHRFPHYCNPDLHQIVPRSVDHDADAIQQITMRELVLQEVRNNFKPQLFGGLLHPRCQLEVSTADVLRILPHGLDVVLEHMQRCFVREVIEVVVCHEFPESLNAVELLMPLKFRSPSHTGCPE